MADEQIPMITNEAFVDVPLGDPPIVVHSANQRWLWATLVGVAVTTIALLLIPSFTLTPGKYNAWATAVQAFGTIMAFTAAAVAFAWQWLRERHHAEMTAARERRAQATSVHAWLTTTQDMTGVGPNELPPFRIHIRNRSELPVFKALVEIVDGRNPGEPELTPTGWANSFDVLPPMSGAMVKLPNYGGAMGWRPAVQISFTDGAGRHWIRHSNGPLVELSRPAWMFKNADLSWSWEGILADEEITEL